MSKTFLNWVGNKSKMVPLLKQLMPQKINTYYEPFLGSGALFLASLPQKAILSDNDENLISVWQAILYSTAQFKKEVNDFLTQLKKPPKAIKENYLDLVNVFNTSSFSSACQKAALFYVLTRYSFRGMFSYEEEKLKAHYGYKALQMLTPEDFNNETLKVLFQLKHKIIHSDFTTIIPQATKDDFLFIDPPYSTYDFLKIDDLGQTYQHGTEWYKNEFKAKEEQKLADLLREAHLKGVKWLHTNFPTPHILKLYQGFNFSFIPATINNQKKNIENYEVIITNYREFNSWQF